MKALLQRREWAPLVVLILVVTVAAMKERLFLDPRNINSILLWMPLILVAAVGQLPIIVMRGIDISIGSTAGLSGIVLGMFLRQSSAIPMPVCFAIGALVGLILGLVNGSLIAFGKLPAIVVTIGTLTAFRGLAYLLSGGDQVDRSLIPEGLTSLARDGIPIGGVTISWLLVIALLVAIAMAIVLKMTQIGRDVFALGSNPNAAHLRGISTNKMTLLAYGFCGLTAGIVGVMYAAKFGFVNPGTTGKSFELTVIAAVAIGGVKITGGSGTILGVLIGCLLLSCINVALTVLGIDANWQMLAYGVTIIGALLLEPLTQKWRKA